MVLTRFNTPTTTPFKYTFSGWMDGTVPEILSMATTATTVFTISVFTLAHNGVGAMV